MVHPNKLRGAYMPDKYGDVIIPITIIRRFECVLEKSNSLNCDVGDIMEFMPNDNSISTDNKEE
jgi:type I restriction-modification system DNA methylase subunit